MCPEKISQDMEMEVEDSGKQETQVLEQELDLRVVGETQVMDTQVMDTQVMDTQVMDTQGSYAPSTREHIQLRYLTEIMPLRLPAKLSPNRPSVSNCKETCHGEIVCAHGCNRRNFWSVVTQQPEPHPAVVEELERRQKEREQMEADFKEALKIDAELMREGVDVRDYFSPPENPKVTGFVVDDAALAVEMYETGASAWELLRR